MNKEREAQLIAALGKAEHALAATLADRFVALQVQISIRSGRADKCVRIGRHIGRLGSALLDVREALEGKRVSL